MLTFAVADLHGRFDLFQLAVDAIAARGGGHVVFLGDYVDRGPASREIVEALMAGPPAGQTWTTLKGNHEEMMARVCRSRAPLSWWLGNGGGPTLAGYGRGDDVRLVREHHLAWIDGLPLMHVDRHRVFLHAGVDPLRPLDQQDDEGLLWKRYDNADERGLGERHVVHGHTPHPDGPLLLSGRTNLETYAWSTGRLVVGVFDDDCPGGPVDLIEIGPSRGRDL